MFNDFLKDTKNHNGRLSQWQCIIVNISSVEEKFKIWKWNVIRSMESVTLIDNCFLWSSLYTCGLTSNLKLLFYKTCDLTSNWKLVIYNLWPDSMFVFEEVFLWKYISILSIQQNILLLTVQILQPIEDIISILPPIQWREIQSNKILWR